MNFPALSNKNYRIYISGQSLSLIGTFMQQLAMSWMIFKLTNSPMWLGIAGFCAQIPTFIFGLFAGIIVDHVDRHKLLMWTQGLAAAQAFTLAALTLTGNVTLVHLLFLEFFLGTINAFDMTTRQAFVVQLIEDKKHLPNAIAINSSIMNLSRLIGPAIGGALISVVGEGICFLINGISYISVLTALYFMKVKSYIPPKFNPKDIFKELNVGFETIFKNPHNKSIILFLVTLSFFGFPYTAFFPAMAQSAPKADATALGLISSFVGIGSLVSALYLSGKRGLPTLAKTVGISGIIFSLTLIILSRVENFSLVLMCVFITGMTLIMQLASCNTMIQSTVDDNKRGRVMSFFNVSLLGIAPIGSLVMGFMAEHLTLKNAILINGCICLIFAILFYKRSESINEYVRAKLA